MIARLKRRYLDILASVYVFNEHRGYSSLDRVLDALRASHPEAEQFITAVEKHRKDERKHYDLFKHWFIRKGVMPYSVDKTCAHIDRLIRFTFGCDVDGIEAEKVIANEALFDKLCRIIVLTEQRGMTQVEQLLMMPTITSDRGLKQIFRIVERDEPSHWMPYAQWLSNNGDGTPRWHERLADWWVHKSLILFKLPLLYCNPWLRRRHDWLDQTDALPAS